MDVSAMYSWPLTDLFNKFAQIQNFRLRADVIWILSLFKKTYLTSFVRIELSCGYRLIILRIFSGEAKTAGQNAIT